MKKMQFKYMDDGRRKLITEKRKRKFKVKRASVATAETNAHCTILVQSKLTNKNAMKKKSQINAAIYVFKQIKKHFRQKQLFIFVSYLC